jgi:hypothetical protein
MSTTNGNDLLTTSTTTNKIVNPIIEGYDSVTPHLMVKTA